MQKTLRQPHGDICVIPTLLLAVGSFGVKQCACCGAPRFEHRGMTGIYFIKTFLIIYTSTISHFVFISIFKHLVGTAVQDLDCLFPRQHEIIALRCKLLLRGLADEVVRITHSSVGFQLDSSNM